MVSPKTSESAKAADKDDVIQEKNLMYKAALCFGIIFVVIGVPLWWKTTEVYRVSLPYSDIQYLSGKTIEYLVDVNVIWAAAETEDSVNLQNLAMLLNTKIQNIKSGVTGLSPLFRVAVREASSSERTNLKKASDISELSSLMSSSELNSYNIIVVHASLFKLSQVVIAPSNNMFVPHSGSDVAGLTDEMLGVLHAVVRSEDVYSSFDSVKGQVIQRPDKATMRSFRYHSGFDVTFTLMVPEPDRVDARWDISAGVKDYLNPLLLSLEEYTQFTVMSQVIYFVSLGAKPRKGAGYFYYEERDLPHVINPLESKLGSHMSNNPGLNFITCVPPVGKSPLRIHDSSGAVLASDAFLSPRWGGVMIYNSENEKSTNQTAMDDHVNINMHKMMSVFVSQARLLLNIHTQIPTSYTQVATRGSSALPQWEVAGWLRCRCVENLATSAATLASLAQLLEEISNIVINEEIGREVESAVAAIKLSHDHLANGRLKEAFIESRNALMSSELAFFHPSLLELLYFPEDQKFAIYIPLFLPISIPVVTSTAQAVKWFYQRKKEKTN